MSQIAVVGGHGRIARLLHPLLVGAGHTPIALVRNEDYRQDLDALGAQMRLLDLEKDEAAQYAESFAGCEAVVFAAGGGGDGDIERKRTVDLEGSLKSIEGAQIAGVKRFVQISAIGVDEDLPADVGEVWAAYVAAKRDADRALRASGLDWTIVRPGGLTDDSGTGEVALDTKVERAEIPRADVAAVIAAALADDASIGHQWEVVSGDTSIDAAIRAAAGK